MKIHLGDIPREGLKIRDSLPVQALNQRMSEGRDNDIIFTEDPQVDLTVTQAVHGADLKGTIKSRCCQLCALCGKDVERELEVHLDLALKPRPDAAGISGKTPKSVVEEEYMDDVGISYFENDILDLEDLIQESLILELSPYWHPAQDEQGRCQACGVNCRKKPDDAEIELIGKQSLGDLLKKAGVN